MFKLRWHVARWMIHAAIRVAPSGPARAALVAHLEAFGAEVMRALAERRK